MYSSDLTAFEKKCCYFFCSILMSSFWHVLCWVLDLVISTYFNSVNGAKCLIHINLCTFHVFKRKTVQDCNDTPVPGTRPLGLWFFNLGHNFLTRRDETGLSYMYCTCVFLVTRPFTWYHNFLTCDLDLELWPTFEKL